MKKESIKYAINIIIEELDKSSMDKLDKVELMINLKEFLNSYEENIKVLRKVKYEDNSTSK